MLYLSFRFSRFLHAYPGVLVSSVSWWDSRNQRKARIFSVSGDSNFFVEKWGRLAGTGTG